MSLTRRGLLKTLLSATALLLAWPVRTARAGGTKKLALPLEKAPKLKEVGGSVTLKLADREILFVRDAETSVRAFQSQCSHQNCPVAWDKASGKVACSCHGSKFDLTGAVLNGPADKPLPTYPATLSGERIIIELPVA